MSKFLNGMVFMIVDDDDISIQMVNYSTSKSKGTMPSKLSGGILKRILETTEPVNSVFAGFQWYDSVEIQQSWEAVIED